MTIEEMNRRKRELGYTNEEISRRSGIPVSTVNKVLSGITKAPRKATLDALQAILAGGSHSQNINYLDYTMQEPCMVNEPVPAYKYIPGVWESPAGPHDLEEYLELPEDQRVELIDGCFYDMAAPTFLHQIIAGQVYFKLMDHVRKNNGRCTPFISPVDVQVDMTDKTVVQPDVGIICSGKDMIRRGRVFGAPDFMLEVLSPSTRVKDMTTKLKKYYESGVREYWIVDCNALKVMVYDLEHDIIIPELYDFTSKIPVKIWNGACEVDFNDIYNYAEPYLDM